MITPTEGPYVRCTTKRVLRGAGVGVLVLSLALTGCQGKKSKKKSRGKSSTSRSRTVGGTSGGSGNKSGGSLSGARQAQSVLPPTDSMPTALRTVTSPLSSRAKAPTSCKEPSSKCKNTVAHGDVGYRGTDITSFEVIVYSNARAAKKAFGSWDNHIRNSASKYQVLDAATYDAGSVTFQFKSASDANVRETVILQGKFIGTLDYRDDTDFANAGASDALAGLARMYAERLRQVVAGETPTASAAGLKVS
ncbi:MULTISPECIES: hypothetical protein [unclassified Streptomyces]|uniref:hypothetical protein n=1 Tax=unclassified Streptomyces TaxID=2593676 RepID=UPI002E80437B|nr:hypothetical protein [Streptomyces sp. NBC_00589]WTI34504.1 hypothetical protein OIC96_05610 [Streptomyces sp. NBC_00775]WUB31824.1 hypothetical protein OHA51_44120 [Streptomyces sp. NBC_00589]